MDERYALIDVVGRGLIILSAFVIQYGYATYS